MSSATRINGAREYPGADVCDHAGERELSIPVVGGPLERIRRLENWAEQVFTQRTPLKRHPAIAARWFESDDRAVLAAPAPAIFSRETQPCQLSVDAQVFVCRLRVWRME